MLVLVELLPEQAYVFDEGDACHVLILAASVDSFVLERVWWF